MVKSKLLFQCGSKSLLFQVNYAILLTMPESVKSTSLPPWERLLNRLNFGDQALSISESQMLLLRVLTDTHADLKTLVGRAVLSLPRLTNSTAALAVRVTSHSTTLLASNLGRKRALPLAGSPFIQRLAQTKGFTVKKLKSSRESEIADRYTSAICMSIGDPSNPLHIILLGKELPNRSNEVFLKLVRNILTTRISYFQLQESTKRESESLTLLTHHLSEGMAVLNSELKVTLWNRPMQRVTGRSPREAVGRHYSEVLQRADGTDWLKGLLDIYTSTPLRNVFNLEFEILAANKERRWVELSGSFMRSPEGNIVQTIVIVRDVSHAKILEERKNEFISIATHELRTPITAIKGYLSLLGKEQKNLTEKQLIYLNRATDANNRLVRLAEDLLRSVQVEEDRLRMNVRPINLTPILEKVVRDLHAKAQAKGLELTLIPPKFDAWITADEEKTEQVFSNLVDNAIKYTPTGSIRLSLGHFEENGQGWIVTHVQDSGIGINSKDYDTIFEKFRRTHNTVEVRESGAGLGLFIVKSFVEKQSGKISVNSKMGKGTTFSVSFPATESPKSINGGDSNAAKE